MRFKEIKTKFGNLIPNNVVEQFTFLQEYSANMDHRYIAKYGNASVINFNTQDDYINAITGIMLINKYRFTRLYESTQQAYDMIFNYDKESTITTVYGEQSLTKNYGEQSATKNYGGLTSTVGEVNSTSTDNVSAYNSDTFSPATTSTSHTDSITNNVGGHVDTEVNAGRTDTEVNAGRTDTTTERTKGNIGVVSAMDLIEKERNIDNFALFDIIFTIIVNSICTGVWEYDD